MKAWTKRRPAKAGTSRPIIRRSIKRTAWPAEKLASVGLAIVGIAQIAVAGAQVVISVRQTEVSERLQLLENARSKPRFFVDSTISAQFRAIDPPRHIRIIPENVSGILWISASQVLLGLSGAGSSSAECAFVVNDYFDTFGPNVRESWAGYQIRLHDERSKPESDPSKLWILALTTVISVSYRDIQGVEGIARYSYIDGTMMPLTDEQFSRYDEDYPILSVKRANPGFISVEMKHMDRKRSGDDCASFMKALND